jgi:membrane protease YdiL (CAAX protease family)
MKAEVPGRYKVTATAYFVCTFAWSLLFWFATVYFGGIDRLPGSLLHYVGGAGPIIAALALIHLIENRAMQKDFWIRTFDPRRMSIAWLLVALLMHPVLVGIAGVADVALGGEVQTKTADLTSLASWGTLIVTVFVLGPLPEEMGWRGVALDRMQAVMSPLGASLLLGTIWSVWHVPLFFIEGTFQNQLIPGSTRFWIFLATMAPLSVVMTWVYNNTDRSILSAVLIHFTGNLCGALLVKTDQMAALELAALVLAAICIAVRWPRLGFEGMDAQSCRVTS